MTLMPQLSPRGLAFLIHEEGVVLKKYLDAAGYPTIGVGHLLTPGELTSGMLTIDGKQVDWRKGLTAQQAQALFRQDVGYFEKAVDRLIDVPLSIPQFDALVSFTYNVGAETKGLKGSTLRRILNAGDYVGVPAQMSRWVKSGGKRDPVLVARRKRESALWRSAA